MQTTGRFRSTLAACVIATAAYAAGVGPALAHEEGPEERLTVKMPRAEGRIGNQEIVITYMPATPLTQSTLTAYLQRYTDGEPTRGATVELTVDFVPGELAEVSPGVYESHDWSLAAGRSDIDAAVTIGGNTLTATIPLTVTSTSSALRPTAPIAVAVVTVPGYVFAAAAGAIYLLVSMLFILRRRARRDQRPQDTGADPIGIVVSRGPDGALART